MLGVTATVGLPVPSEDQVLIGENPVEPIGAGALLEYDKLKEEQVARITARDNLLNYNLVALGAVATVASSLETAELGFLTAPWISAIFGWSYLQHDEKITAIGRYLKRQYGQTFPWESSTKQVSLRKGVHKAFSLLILLTAFAMPCIGGPLAWYLSSTSHEPAFMVIAVIECLLGVAIGLIMVISSDFVKRFDVPNTHTKAAMSNVKN